MAMSLRGILEKKKGVTLQGRSPGKGETYCNTYFVGFTSSIN